jgi:large subunit ribosomal protein L5
MHFLEHFYIKTLKYDLANKFLYKSTKKIPKLKKIILNFGCKTSDIKHLASSLLALELITNQKGTMTTTKHSNILLKIRKGNPTGCKITLRKNKMLDYLSKILIEIFPRLKSFEGFKFNRKIKKNYFSYELHDTFNFTELEEHYYLFNNLAKLDVTLVTNTETKKELLFVLKSLQFPLKK